MKEVVYLVVTRSGVNRMVKSLPALKVDERAISLEISVPDSAFRIPVPKAVLNIADDNLIRPVVEVAVSADTVEQGVHGR